MNLAKWILKLAGWKVVVSVPDYPKAVISVAPHTSNWDFVIGELAYASIGRKAGFLMKESWFFFPLGPILRALGGIPVPRRRGSSLVDTIVDKFNHTDRMVLAITPEGTRSLTTEWRHGFLYIANEAKVPIILAAIDFKEKTAYMTRTFETTGDAEADLRAVKDYYRPFTGRHPENFSAE